MWLYEQTNTEISVFFCKFHFKYDVYVDVYVNKNVVFVGKLAFAFLYWNLQIKTLSKPYSILLSIRNMPEGCQVIGTSNTPNK